ncbi:hypothetical protein K504DRAFT_507179, partial [Pleomassaria siparia CBS 279.74]
LPSPPSPPSPPNLPSPPNPSSRPSRPSRPSPFSPLTQLQRYLIEIVTYTIDADFGLVSQALGCDESGTGTGTGSSSSPKKVTSILMDDEKEELFRLATIILDLHQKHLANQWNLTLDCDRAAIRTAISKPAMSMRINRDYILDVISTYAEYVDEDSTCPGVSLYEDGLLT